MFSVCGNGSSLALRGFCGFMDSHRLLTPLGTMVLESRERHLIVVWNVIFFVVIGLAMITNPFVPTSAVVFNEVNSFVASSRTISAAIWTFWLGAFHDA